jgi:hypothetical protein
MELVLIYLDISHQREKEWVYKYTIAIKSSVSALQSIRTYTTRTGALFAGKSFVKYYLK